MKNWLHDFVEQHKELETPRSFWMWSGLTAISAAIKDNIWMDRQIYKLYGNIYTMLHAESGLKKGPAVNAARKLVLPIKGMRIITGRSSIQGILKEMGTAQTTKGGNVSLDSACFICSSELSSSIVEDPVATKILTDLYDRNYNEGEWRSLLKMESFQLKNPTVSMLGATNEAMSEDFFTKSAIQGGYFARTFIIYEKESVVSNSLSYPLEKNIDYKQLSEYLVELSQLKGPFEAFASLEKSDKYHIKKVKSGRDIYFNEIGYMYDEWYENFNVLKKTQEIKDETGTLNRFGDSVLKVAMLLSLARSPELRITTDAMEEAITECEKLLGNVRKTTLGKHGLSSSQQLKSLIMAELFNREDHRISAQMLMKKMWMHYESPEEFRNIMNSFEAAGMISTESIGNNVIYKMTDTYVKQLKEYMAAKARK